ncbi:hypothetical protein L218DRAFT_950351 [Marasmius fiardii PR-910]|nr:hypothetical protein L218DRAFT_950351 [Marasmius fiardii PR-910]
MYLIPIYGGRQFSLSFTCPSSFVEYCISWSSLALLYYDYALTFGTEVKHIWGRKMSLSTFITTIDGYASSPSMNRKHFHSCDTWLKIIDVLAVFGRASVIVSFIVRTYAMYNRNQSVLLYLAALGLAIVITDSPFGGCSNVGTLFVDSSPEMEGFLMISTSNLWERVVSAF